MPQITSFGVSGSGSVVVNKLDGNESSSTLTSSSATPVAITAPAVTLAAKDSTEVRNWGGAVAFGKQGTTVGAANPDESSPQATRGHASIAGSANFNYISRDVNSTLNNVDFGAQQSTLNLNSSTEGAMATAGAISLSVAVSPGKTLSIPGSLAVNKNAASNPSPATKASISNIRGTAIKSVNATAIEGADANAYAGSLGLAANPLEPSPSASTSPQVAATLGFSVAINDLQAGSSAELSGSTLTTAAAAPITIRAKTRDVDLQTVSISAAGSSSNSTAGATLGSYAVSGAGAEAEN